MQVLTLSYAGGLTLNYAGGLTLSYAGGLTLSYAGGLTLSYAGGLTLSFFFLSGVMNPFLAFLPAACKGPAQPSPSFSYKTEYS
jgi:hypothetical protein